MLPLLYSSHWGSRPLRAVALTAVAMLSIASAEARAQDEASSVRPAEFGEAGIEQRIGEQVPLDSRWKTAEGESVLLGDFFGDRPVVLVPAYYRCPMLCTLILESLVKSLKVLTFDAGSEYEVVTFSFNPDETPADALIRKERAIDFYDRGGLTQGGADGWHFLTGDQAAVSALTRAIGFKAELDPNSNEFIHAASVLLITPEGTISRYLYGVDYPPKNLRLGLVEASENRLGNPIDQVLLYCYRYNPATGKYTLLTMRLLRIGGFLTILGLAALVTVLIRLEKHNPQSHRAGGSLLTCHWIFPFSRKRASTMAGQVDAIYLFLVALSAFFSILIAGAVAFCAIRYRRRSEDEVGSTLHGSILLEIIWSAIPLAIVLFLFFWGAKVFFAQSRPPANALEYTAIGKQWMWQFQHPDGQRELNTLHVPIGQPIKITAISQDVIHSLYFPAFRVKKDVLPGRYTTVWFEATKTGSYHLFCAEFCGAEHSAMTGQVIVLGPEQYERWLAGGAAASKPPVEAGADLFEQLACATCHGATAGRGPALRDVYGHEVTLVDGRTVLADDQYMRESILNPADKIVEGYQPIMPTYQGQISEGNVFKLLAYIESLSTPSEEPAEAAPSAEPAETLNEDTP